MLICLLRLVIYNENFCDELSNKIIFFLEIDFYDY